VALLAADNKYSTFKMASWGFGSLWGGNAAKKKDSTKNAILGLRSTLEMLSKREKHLQNQMDEQDAIARKHVSSNKSREYSCPSRWIELGWHGPIRERRKSPTTRIHRD
jgi:hypothetical protein